MAMERCDKEEDGKENAKEKMAKKKCPTVKRRHRGGTRFPHAVLSRDSTVYSSGCVRGSQAEGREVEKNINALSNRYSEMDSALDNNMTTERLEKAVDVLREINSPAQLRTATREQENHSVRLSTIETQTIPNLDKRITKMEHLHNGRHISVPSN